MPPADEREPPSAPRRAQFAWALFDWANNAFPTVIITFVFAAYFTREVAPSETEGTELWGYIMSFSALLVAVSAPVIGAVGDHIGRVKPWLFAGMLLCTGATAALWFVRPTPDDLVIALAALAVAHVGFEACLILYNSMLPDLVPRGRLGRLSGWGWGMGYAGGLACLTLALFVFVRADPPPFGLDPAAAEQVRIVGPLVSVWFLFFAMPLFVFVPDRPHRGSPLRRAVRLGLAQLKNSVNEVRRYANVVRFLVAHLFYIDGLNTLFAFGGVYAAGTFGMTVEEVILFGIALNVTAGLGAALGGWVDDRIGARRTVLLSLGAMSLLLLPLLLVESAKLFWIFGLSLSVFFGPVQAASRSLMARIAPSDLRTQMFGLYAMSSKITAFVGPALVGWLTAVTDSQRFGISVILALFLLGGLLLLRVRETPP